MSDQKFTPDELREMADWLAPTREDDAADMLNYAATLVEQAERTCEGCRFARKERKDNVIEPSYRFCDQPEIRTVVPKEVNGQPFGCNAWQAKESR